MVITQGFIASDAKGETVLLGRGGSDTSGSYFAAKLGARRLEIWTDVPGMFTANPRAVPNARLLKSLDYDEAQEIASSGAKVLHPRCILPAKQYAIPLSVHATHMPELEGTVITATGGDGGARVKAVCSKKGITLLSMETLGMWHQVGFLADAFAVFKEHGLSVDLVSTSETSVTVSLDPAANTLDARALEALVASLSKLCRVEVIGPCAAVSLVGRSIRATLHRLGDALELFEEQRIYLVTQAANDLNITFVVDEEQGDRLVSRLHDVIVRNAPSDHVLGPTWEQIHGLGPRSRPAARRGGRAGATKLAAHRAASTAAPTSTTARRSSRPRGSCWRSAVSSGCSTRSRPTRTPRSCAPSPRSGSAFECVSQGECERVLEVVPGIDRDKILFTPNFAPRSEYEWALAQGVHVTLDNLYPLRALAGAVPRPRRARAHRHRTSAAATTTTCAPRACTRSSASRCSSWTNSTAWSQRPARGSSGCTPTPAAACSTCATGDQVGQLLGDLAQRFPARARRSTSAAASACPRSPARCRWTSRQLQGVDRRPARAAGPGSRSGSSPAGSSWRRRACCSRRSRSSRARAPCSTSASTTGMNSLIRPALYGAHHDIVNLTRFGEPGTEVYNVVGPICESADYLGHERLLPPTAEGDTLLIANAGAYGHVMSSWYNLREPAREILI